MTNEEFWVIMTTPDPPKIFFRLYYDDRGRPLFYTMQDEPGNYIEIDQETFQRGPAHVRVRNGKLVELVTVEIKKLIPGNEGTCCSPTDVCVIVDGSQPHTKWSLKIDETN